MLIMVWYNISGPQKMLSLQREKKNHTNLQDVGCILPETRNKGESRSILKKKGRKGENES